MRMMGRQKAKGRMNGGFVDKYSNGKVNKPFAKRSIINRRCATYEDIPTPSIWLTRSRRLPGPDHIVL